MKWKTIFKLSVYGRKPQRAGDAETFRRKMPQKEDEIAVPKSYLKRIGKLEKLGTKLSFTFLDGTTETFTVTGFLKEQGSQKYIPLFYLSSTQRMVRSSRKYHIQHLYGFTMQNNTIRRIFK